MFREYFFASEWYLSHCRDTINIYINNMYGESLSIFCFEKTLGVFISKYFPRERQTLNFGVLTTEIPFWNHGILTKKSNSYIFWCTCFYVIYCCLSCKCNKVKVYQACTSCNLTNGKLISHITTKEKTFSTWVGKELFSTTISRNLSWNLHKEAFQFKYTLW